MTNIVLMTLGAALSFSDMVHNMKYGEVTTNAVTVTVTTRMEKAVVLDDDGATREFAIDAYKLDPPSGCKCTYVHLDGKCAYWDMYLKRHEIYLKRDALREKWMQEEMERQRNPEKQYPSLLRRSLLRRY